MEQDVEGQKAIARAMASVRAAIPAAEADAERPVFHFRAPALWMNDPNGPIYYRGWYHLFYQFNPYGDQWGNMHWGHARSKDLVNWEDLPIALWPSKSRGEDHVFSGSTFLDAGGKPVIFYTSIGDGREPEQWAAVPNDEELLRWSKLPGDPVLSQKAHGGVKLAEWRDPFLFRDGGQTYMAVGGGEGGRGIVALYRSTKPDLSEWHYEGVVFQHPDTDVHNIECPNLVKLGDRWVLLVSVHGRVESFVGRMDVSARSFVVQKRGVLAEGSYASQILRDRRGRAIHLAWLPTSDRKGWNGCLALPSVLSLAKDGTLLRKPVSDLVSLRGRSVRLGEQSVDGYVDLSDRIAGDALEIETEIDARSAAKVGIRLRASSDGKQGTDVVYDVASRKLVVPGHAPIALSGTGTTLRLRLFLDKRTLDVYTADGKTTACVATVPAQKGDIGLGLFSEGGAARLKSMAAYEMRPAKFDLTRFN